MRMHPTFANIGLSKIVQVSERARLLAPDFEKKSGKPFIYFQRGEVGYPLAPFILDGLREAIEKGWTKYPKSGGEAFFKEAVVANLASRGIEGLKPDNILATMGGQEGLQLIFSYFRGRACAGFTPCWSCMFDNIFPYTETTFIPIPLSPGNGWAMDFAALERVLPQVDAFYFNSPHNPTGRVFPRADIERLCAMCQKYGVLLVCDEAYKDLAYTGEHFSPLQDPRWENVAVVNTFSKAFAATGFRIGYTVCRRTDLIESLTRAEYSQTAGIPTPIQFAFSKALSHPGAAAWLKTYKEEMKLRAAALADNLDPKLNAHAPQGAFYSFIDLAPGRRGDVSAIETAMVDRLMNAGIAVVPGSAFGQDFTGYARLSFSTLAAPVIAEGAKRFNKVVLNPEA